MWHFNIAVVARRLGQKPRKNMRTILLAVFLMVGLPLAALAIGIIQFQQDTVAVHEVPSVGLNSYRVHTMKNGDVVTMPYGVRLREENGVVMSYSGVMGRPGGYVRIHRPANPLQTELFYKYRLKG